MSGGGTRIFHAAAPNLMKDGDPITIICKFRASRPLTVVTNFSTKSVFYRWFYYRVGYLSKKKLLNGTDKSSYRYFFVNG